MSDFTVVTVWCCFVFVLYFLLVRHYIKRGLICHLTVFDSFMLFIQGHGYAGGCRHGTGQGK